MKKILNCLLFFAFGSIFQDTYAYHNINLIGYLNNYDSLARHTSSFIDALPSNLPIKLFKTKIYPSKNLPDRHKKITQQGIGLLDSKNIRHRVENGLKVSGVSIYTDSWWYFNQLSHFKLIPNSSIKWAYCVIESTKVHPKTVEKLNKTFDAIIVVDEWFVNVCKKSGITIPVFSLPLALNDLRPLLARPLKTSYTPKEPFVFGCSGLFSPRKNQTLLIRAFHEEFKKEPHVRLVIHGKTDGVFKKIESLTKQLKNNRIKLLKKNLSRAEYENLIANFHCYCLVSKGEGFSITPREALAAGIPCILSNNTGHKTFCKEKVVYGIPSNDKEPAAIFIGRKLVRVPGEQFNCKIKDVRRALREVYKNYSYYLAQAQKGREWVKQYLPENLSLKYLNVVNPSKVVFGPHNKITNEYLMTNSKKLFEKYHALCNPKETSFEVAQ